MTAEPFALYVHVPWCRHVCPYCDFNVYAAAEPPERPYVEAVAAELRAWAARAQWRGRRAKTVYLGGGTPSLLSPGAIATVLEAVARALGIADGAEVTLEATPGTVTRERLAGYRAAGVNRLSLGAQSFHAGHLRALGRDHGAADVRAAMEAARAAGFANLSLDLIFAVPDQTLADWEDDLGAALALAPEHRWANGRLPGRYLVAIRERGTAVATEERLSTAQARGEFCFTGLRQTVGVDLEGFRRRFGVELDAAFPHLERLVTDGLVEASGQRLRLTARGFRFADSVAASFV